MGLAATQLEVLTHIFAPVRALNLLVPQAVSLSQPLILGSGKHFLLQPVRIQLQSRLFESLHLRKT